MSNREYIKMTTINIAKEFSDTPGGRRRNDGPFSGQEFREHFLEKHFEDKSDVSKLVIVLDGVFGYATSFLEEAFGGLARKYGQQRVLLKLEFISEEEPLLIEEITNYIKNAGKGCRK